MDLQWRKSSRSAGGDNADCIELATTGSTIHLRDSKNHPGPILTLPATTWPSLRTWLETTDR